MKKKNGRGSILEQNISRGLNGVISSSFLNVAAVEMDLT